MKHNLIQQTISYKDDYGYKSIVVYGSWDCWKNPHKLYHNTRCTWVNYGYKPHYCNERCTVNQELYIKYIQLPASKYYFKFFDTATNTWIEPSETDKKCTNWIYVDKYWNMIYSVH